MNNSNSTQERKTQQLRAASLQLWIYLLPVVGILPSLLTLIRGKGSRQQQAVSRLSLTLMLIWLGTYSLLTFGSAQTSELTAVRLLYTNGLLTTGYFLLCISLMLRLGQGEPPRLPVISKFADTIMRNYLP